MTLNITMASSNVQQFKLLRSFLGPTGFYRDFITNYSDVALPLTILTRKGGPDKVGLAPEQEKAFGLFTSLLLS